MTTREAAERYEAEHLRIYAGRKPVVFNPHRKPESELPTILGFNNTMGRKSFQEGILVAEDGKVLGGHLCSSEAYMLADLGIVEGWQDGRHETFRAHYPDGYRMEFVPSGDIDSHPLLQRLISEAKGEDPTHG